MQQYPLKRRATAEQLPPHRAGHSSQIHPEDEPYSTGERKRYSNPLDVADQLDYPGEPTRMPSSAVRYVDRQGNTVIQRGRERFVIHEKPPRRPHWLFIFGIGMLVMIAFFIIWNWGGAWWAQHQLDATYGMPRTWQTDQVVGIGDSQAHPSHFIFLNLGGKVEVIFFPGGDASKAKIYIGPTIFSDNPAGVPATGEFRDVGNGKIDMIVHIGNQQIIYLNTGTDFKPQ